jgi:hypothetical protein
MPRPSESRAHVSSDSGFVPGAAHRPHRSRRLKWLRVPSGLIALTLCLTIANSWLTSADAAPALQCGSRATVSVRLQADILHCTGPGLVVAAPNVVIDLNGHTIEGTVTSTREQCLFNQDPNNPDAGDVCTPCDAVGFPACDPDLPNSFVSEDSTVTQAAGVDNTAGFDGVTVRGGTVRDFKDSYHAVNASRFTVVAFARTATSGGCVCLEDSDTGQLRTSTGPSSTTWTTAPSPALIS